MSLLIDEYQRRYRELDKEFDSTCAQLLDHKNRLLYLQYDKELGKHLEQFNREGVFCLRDPVFDRIMWLFLYTHNNICYVTTLTINNIYFVTFILF